MTSQRAYAIMMVCFLMLSAYCVGVILSLGVGSASAQQSPAHFLADRVTANAGENVVVGLNMLSSANDVHGFSVNITHDGSVLDVVAANPSEYLNSLNGGFGPDYFETRLWNQAGSAVHGLAVMCILDLSSTQNTIPASSVYHRLVKAEYSILPNGVPGQTFSMLRWSDTLMIGPTQVYNEITVQGGVAVSPLLGNGKVTVAINFIRGDINMDGLCTLSDAVALLHHLFSASDIYCKDSADANDDTQLNIADVMLVLGYSLTGSLPPEAPFPDCMYDMTDDTLGCQVSSNCP